MKLREHPGYGGPHLYVQYSGNRRRGWGEHQADSKKKEEEKEKKADEGQKGGIRKRGHCYFCFSAQQHSLGTSKPARSVNSCLTQASERILKLKIEMMYTVIMIYLAVCLKNLCTILLISYCTG